MSDVMKKVIEANDIHEGWALVYTDKQGNQQVLEPEHPDHISPSGEFGRLKDRFDDVQYYTS